jgi:hypothetical protein
MMAATTIKLYLKRIKRDGRYAWRIACSVFIFLLAGCAPLVEATPFIPPTAPSSPTLAATVISLWTATPASENGEADATSMPDTAPTPTGEPTATAAPTACTNDLKFLADLTVPDGSPVEPGARIDKQWLVRNSGTCNWDADYRLRLVGGFPPLGAEIIQALFPARAGAEVTIQIFFTAPPASGVYRSAWQAYDAQGTPFGETIYIEITVP